MKPRVTKFAFGALGAALLGWLALGPLRARIVRADYHELRAAAQAALTSIAERSKRFEDGASAARALTDWWPSIRAERVASIADAVTGPEVAPTTSSVARLESAKDVLAALDRRLVTLEEAWPVREELEAWRSYAAALERAAPSMRGRFRSLIEALDAAREAGDLGLAAQNEGDAAQRYRAGRAQAHELAGPLLEQWLESMWSTPDEAPKDALRAAAQAHHFLTDAASDTAHPALRGRALIARALCEHGVGEFDTALALYQEATRLFADLDEPQWQAEGHAGAGGCFADRAQPDWREAVAQMREARRLFERAGHAEYERRSTLALAAYVRPDLNPNGSWEEALELYGRAEVLAKQLKLQDAERAAAALRGDCLRPGTNPNGSWPVAAAHYRRAYSADAAQLLEVARAARPAGDRPGDWAIAVEFCESAAQLARTNGDDRSLANCLAQLSELVSPELSPDGDRTKHAAVIAEHAKVALRLGRHAESARLFASVARLEMPSEQSDGSWSRAAGLFAQAVEPAERSADQKLLAYVLHQRAYCLIAGDSARMTDQARALFERSADLSHALGDAEAARVSESFLGPSSATGAVVIHRTWNNASEPVGAETYDVGLQVELRPSPRAVLTYRGARIELQRQGQQFSFRPYANTSATATVRQLVIDRNRVAIAVDSRGNTHNPSVVFAGGYNHPFTSQLVIEGSWTSAGLQVEIEERNAFDGFGNAQWEGRGRLPRSR